MPVTQDYYKLQDATHFLVQDVALACGGILPSSMAGGSVIVMASRREVQDANWWADLQTLPDYPPVGLVVQAVGKDFSASKLSKRIAPAACL